MLQTDSNRYPLCLLDTMAVSEMVKEDPRGPLRNFYEWALSEDAPVVPAFSIYTLLELRRRPDVFELFIEGFKILPCVVLKGYLELIEEEVASYPDPSAIVPVGLVFTPLGGAGNKMENLPSVLDQLAEQEAGWNAAEASIVDGIASLRSNFPPSAEKYTDSDVELFVMAASLQQLALHTTTEPFVRQMHDDGVAVDIDAFPSLKAMTFTVFHKFYADASRKPNRSDGFDILISSGLPYVEAVITEAHQAESLGKTKRRDDFLRHLDVYNLRDLRTGSLRPIRPR